MLEGFFEDPAQPVDETPVEEVPTEDPARYTDEELKLMRDKRSAALDVYKSQYAMTAKALSLEGYTNQKQYQVYDSALFEFIPEMMTAVQVVTRWRQVPTVRQATGPDLRFMELWKHEFLPDRWLPIDLSMIYVAYNDYMCELVRAAVEGVDRTKLDLLQEQLELLNGIVPQSDVQL